MTFHYSDKFIVTLDPSVESFFNNMMHTFDYNLESGGILVGMYDNNSMIITDITTPQIGDCCQRHRFQRSETKHQELMDELWEKSGYKKIYLGEWHSHCEVEPHPSCIDVRGWKRKVKEPHNAPWMIFLILGQEKLNIWTVEDGNVKELVLDA